MKRNDFIYLLIYLFRVHHHHPITLFMFLLSPYLTPPSLDQTEKFTLFNLMSLIPIGFHLLVIGIR